MSSKKIKTAAELTRLYPPRAEILLPPEKLREARGFIAEYKYNDIRTLFHFLNGKILILTRKREPVKEYSLTPRMKTAFETLELDPTRLHTLDGGILRHLKEGDENPIVLWDILVHDSVSLVHWSTLDRYELLKKVCATPKHFEKTTGCQIGLEIDGPLWLAPIFSKNFSRHFQLAQEVPYLEGLILKDPNATLSAGTGEFNNTNWQLKVRKPAKNYAF